MSKTIFEYVFNFIMAFKLWKITAKISFLSSYLYIKTKFYWPSKLKHQHFKAIHYKQKINLEKWKEMEIVEWTSSDGSGDCEKIIQISRFIDF
jgi:hypothetical protein